MGVYPNDDGHKCIADLIWEADTHRPRRHAAEMEAGRAGGAQLEHLPVVILLSGLRQGLPRAGLIYCRTG